MSKPPRAFHARKVDAYIHALEAEIDRLRGRARAWKAAAKKRHRRATQCYPRALALLNERRRHAEVYRKRLTEILAIAGVRTDPRSKQIAALAREALDATVPVRREKGWNPQ